MHFISPFRKLTKRHPRGGLILFGLLIFSASVAVGQTKTPTPPLASPPTTGAITGEVSDKSGTPLAGAEVKLTGQKAAASSTVTTDAHGAFNISRLEPGKYQITISAKGCLPKTQKVSVKAGGKSKVHVQLKAPPSPKKKTS